MSLSLKPGILSKLKRKLYLYLSDNKKSNERFNVIEPKALSTVKIKEETISISIRQQKKNNERSNVIEPKSDLLSKLKRKLYLYLSDNKKNIERFNVIEPKALFTVKIKEEIISISIRQQKSNERLNVIEPKAWSTVKIKEETISVSTRQQNIAMRGLMSLSLKPGILSKLKRKLYLYLSDNKKQTSNERLNVSEPKA